MHALANGMQGDEYVVNCLEPHPWQPLVLATSGEGRTFVTYFREASQGFKATPDLGTGVVL